VSRSAAGFGARRVLKIAVPDASASLLASLRRALGLSLIALGVLALGAGVAYWWQGWPFMRLVLGIGAGAGLALLGAGAVVAWPTSPAGCLTGAVCLVGSGGVFFVLSLLQPIVPALSMVAAVVAALGGVSYVGYLWNRRAKTPAPPPPSAPPSPRT
jgi:hypothetical protein